ncbi:hypothetical protein [Rhizobium sp. RU35A]|uniref:DUF6950 family protein n=1 Tax=Rhizobium sp. RU35A TaxID=1907414 RepID=UPI00122C190C|nr:hypothetical protein [Rhizobium sp. RU35A]
MTILDELTSFLEESADVPLVWGQSDCTAWSAAWVERATGCRIVMPEWSSRDEAMEYIAGAGSLANLWSDIIDDDDSGVLMDGHGEPSAGDVGIIETHLAGQVGGVFLNHRNFAWRGDAGGFRIIRPRLHTIVKFWRLQCAS